MTYIVNLATSPAPYPVSIEDLIRFLEHQNLDSGLLRKFKVLAKTGGIATKYSALPHFSRSLLDSVAHLDWNPGASTHQRNALFQSLSLNMLTPVCKEVLQNTRPQEITHIITMTCTGLSAPGLEIELLQELGLLPTVQKHAVNFMGCYAAIHAMRLAHLICTQDPNAKVLLAGIELCTLHFHLPKTDSDLLSTYLFSDGVVAALISAQAPANNALKVLDFSSFCQPHSHELMSWDIGNYGFDMYLSSEVPAMLNQSMGKAFDKILGSYPGARDGVLRYAIHPGGKAILEAVSGALQLQSEDLIHAYSVLNEYGNMSSVTLFFVLQRIQLSLTKTEITDNQQLIYAAAFGPGLSIEQMLLTWVTHNPSIM